MKREKRSEQKAGKADAVKTLSSADTKVTTKFSPVITAKRFTKLLTFEFLFDLLFPSKLTTRKIVIKKRRFLTKLKSYKYSSIWQGSPMKPLSSMKENVDSRCF